MCGRQAAGGRLQVTGCIEIDISKLYAIRYPLYAIKVAG